MRTVTRSSEVGLNTSRIASLDGFRGYAIIMVVATHAVAYADLEASLASTLIFWVQAVAVPPFFLADGSLFVHSLQKHPRISYKAYCARSARRLLLPWAFFSLFYLGLRAGFEYVTNPPVTIVLHHSLGEIFAAVYYSSISAQLYFLPALFFIRILSFATRYLTLLPPLWLVMVWLAYVSVWQAVPIGDGQDGQIDPALNAVWGMQYYLLGMALAIHEDTLRRNPFLLAGVSLTCLLFIKICCQPWVILAQYAYLCSLYFVFVGLGDKGHPFTLFGRLTMGIYLIHAPVVLKFVSYGALKMFDHSEVARYLAISSGVAITSLIIVRMCAGAVWWKYLLGEGFNEVKTPLKA